MEYKDLMLKENETLKVNPKKEEGKIKKSKEVKYAIEYENNLDVAISRKTSRTEKLLVCLPSQDLFYVKSKDSIIDMTKDEDIAKKEVKNFFKELKQLECIEGKNIKIEKDSLWNILFLFSFSKVEKFNSLKNMEVIKEIMEILFSIGVELKGRMIPKIPLYDLCVILDLNIDTGKTREEKVKDISNYMKNVIMYFYEKGKIQNLVNTLFKYYYLSNYKRICFDDYYPLSSDSLEIWEYQAIFNRLTIAYIVKGEPEKAFQFFKKLMESDYNKIILETKDGVKTKFDLIYKDTTVVDAIIRRDYKTGSDESLEDLIRIVDKIPESKENNFWEYLANYPKFQTTVNFPMYKNTFYQNCLNRFLYDYCTLFKMEERIFEGEIPVIFMNQEFMSMLKKLYPIYPNKIISLWEISEENKKNLQNWLLQISQN